MNNKTVIMLIILVIINLSFVSAVSEVNVRVLTDKNEYAPGDKISVTIVLTPKTTTPVTFYDVSMNLVSDDQDAILFPHTSGLDSIVFSTFFSERAGAYISAKGNYYGWWVFGTRDGSKGKEQISLTTSTELTRFIAVAKSVPAGTTKTVTLTPTNVKVLDYASLKPVNVVAYTLPKTITIKSSACTTDAFCGSGNYCVNNVCKDGAVGSSCTGASTCDLGFCVNSFCTDGAINSNCAADADCSTGFQCYNLKCQTGTEGSPCGTTAADCNTGFDCMAGKCTAPVEPQICGPSTDCDSDGIVNKNDKCPTDKTGIKTTPFASGAFIGCMKADINLDGTINSADITKFIEYYGKRDTYPSVTLTKTY